MPNRFPCPLPVQQLRAHPRLSVIVTPAILSRLGETSAFGGECRGFILQCRLVFTQRARVFVSDKVKINYIVKLLHGRALAWVQASSTRTHLNTLSLEEFTKRFEWVFDHPDRTGCVSDCLFMLQQGARSVPDYAVEFGILAAESGWDRLALQGAFRQGLSWRVHYALVTGVRPKDQN